MPKLRGMRAVVQFLRQFAEPRAAPPTQSLHGFADGSSGCQGTSSLPAPVRLSVAAFLLLFCEAAQRSADPELRRSDR